MSSFGGQSSSDDPRAFIDDPTFLLRCAATSNWHGVIERTVEINDLFSNPSDEPSWKIEIEAAKEQLLARDEWGNTPLSLACFHNPPSTVVMALLGAARAASRVIMGQMDELTSVTTRDHSTPLLIACATGASSSTIRMLLNPPGNSCACYPDDAGETPLSQLCIRYEKRRLSTDPAIEEVDKKTAASCFDYGDVGRYSQLFTDFWCNVKQVLHMEWQAEFPREEWCFSVLHGAAFMCESCPPSLTRMITNWYPEMAEKADKYGVLPLHFAIHSIPYSHLKLKEQQAIMILRLLELYPDGALLSVPGSTRNLFCHAICAGLDWNLLNSSEGPLMRLWTCAPKSVYQRDTLTGLYPYLLAATVGPEEQNGSNDDDDKADVQLLSNIYSLLRIYPQVVQDALTY